MNTRNQFTALLMILSAVAVTLSSVPSIQAQQVVGGQCGICGQWYAGSHSCSPPQPPRHYPGASSSSGESADQRLSREANNAGIAYHNRGDFLNAIRQYKLALHHSPDNGYARTNLRIASENYSRKCNNAGAAFHQNGDFHGALRYYQLALQYWPDNDTAQDNLERAFKSLRDKAAAAKEAQEREELRRRIAESERKIDAILERVKSDFDGRRTGTLPSPGSNSKIGSTESSGAEPQPHLDSSVVDLRDRTTDIVDPRKVKGKTSSRLEFTESFGAKPQSHLDSSVVDLRDRTTEIVDPRKVKGTTSKPKPPTANPKTVALLDALEAGQGNWDKSVDWLRARVLKNPSDDQARDAYQFVLGLSGGLHERVPKSPLDDIQLPDRPGATHDFRDPKTHAITIAALAAVADEDYASAHKQFALAHQKEPAHSGIRDCMNWSEGLAAAQSKHSHDPILDPKLLALAQEQIIKDVQESESRRQEQALLNHIRRQEAQRKPAPAKGYFQRIKEYFGS